MRRVATIISGSACCVYGLTFTSHFYGARRTVGYVPFNSETLVTGKLFEDIRDAVHETAKPEEYDAVIVTNLCVPTASGVPLELLPKSINGVRIIGIDVPGFGVPTHAEAKDVLSGAMLRYARLEAEAGPVARPRNLVEGERTIALIGELFPADPMGIGALLAPMGLGLAPQTPARDAPSLADRKTIRQQFLVGGSSFNSAILNQPEKSRRVALRLEFKELRKECLPTDAACKADDAPPIPWDDDFRCPVQSR
jgi:chlorophyllide reductase subunit Y